MAYRKILVPIFGSRRDQAALEGAFGLAKQFGAHVEALFVRPDPVSGPPYGYLDGDFSGYAARFAIEAAIKAGDAAQKAATGTFDRTVDKCAIQVIEKPSEQREATAHLRIVEADFVAEIERQSRLSDLIVFAASPTETEQASIQSGLESALLSGARPVLFMPRDAKAVPGRRIAIAYDGSAAAAHAVTCALPFLERASELHAFEVTGEKSATLSELQAYLTLRGLKVIEHVVDPGPKTTAEALMLAVTAKKCDTLVLGGYGHSRIRELVFGGVTRHVLTQRTDVTVLMAH